MNQALAFDGKTYEAEFDFKRLTSQLNRVKVLMVSGLWFTLGEIARHTGDPESSVSARLRDLRKPRNGGWKINRRHRGDRHDGHIEYQMLP